MSKRLILFTIALLLILTFALAQDQQDSNRKPPQQAGGDSNNNNNNGSGNQQQEKPKKDQQNNGKQGRPNNNSESSQESNHNNDRQSNHHNRRGPRGFPFGMIFSFMAYLISAFSLIVTCGAGIAFIILKKKGYSISIHKKEASHQPLREEEELPSQYLPQVPVVNVMMSQQPSVQSSQPIVGVYYPNLQQQPIQQENPEQKV